MFDNPSITTDVMVGFAGESDEEFKKSLSFVKSIGFAKVHIFPYSRRKGTVADRYENQISPDVKKARAAEMAEETAVTTKAFLQSQVGRIEKVLIETRNKNGRYRYTKTSLRSKRSRKNIFIVSKNIYKIKKKFNLKI